jgi:insertion element IS1 protein InsB
VALSRLKKRKCWICKALDRATRRTVAWVVGRRNAAPFRRLYEQVKGDGRTYVTDDWPVYRAVLPEAQHVIGRVGTQTVERDNANTRHYSVRLARRTKVVSKSLPLVDLSIKLGILFADPAVYAVWQAIFVSVFT